MPYGYNPVATLLTPEQMGSTNYYDALKKGLMGARESMETTYKPKDLAEKLLSSQLKNKHDSIINEFLPRSEQARISSTEAGTGQTLEDTLRQHILNQYLPQKEEADIASTSALAKMRSSGGGSGGGVALKEEANLLQQVARDNPGLTEEQVRAAADAYSSGSDITPEGVQLAPISPSVRRALDRLALKSSTSALITNSVKADQAEDEIDAGSDYIQKLAQPYGTTYLGVSPQQIIDSFGTDAESQKRMGKYMGIQALQYELAQVRNRIAGGEPGISATNELMGHSGQIIQNFAPIISGQARQEAERVINEGIKEMAKARKGAGVSPSKSLEKRLKEAGGRGEDLSATTQEGGIHEGQLYDYHTGEWK